MSNSLEHRKRWGAFIICCGISGAATADSLAVTTIKDGSFHDARGVVTVNIGAGSDSMQFNGIGMSVSKTESAVTRVRSKQTGKEQSTGVAAPAVAIARIGKGSFKNARGVVAINQASGLGNAQANGVAISVSNEGEALADVDLSQNLPEARLRAGNQTKPDGTLRSVSVQDNAFAGTRGLVQVNQAAGSWNATANSFALRISAGAVP